MTTAYTYAELLSEPERVLSEVEDDGEEVLITRHGRFVLAIVPVDDTEIIASALASGPLADELARRAADDRPGLTSDEVRRRITE